MHLKKYTDYSANRLLFISSLLALLGFFLYFFFPFFSGKVLSQDDLGLIHLPLRAFYSECLKNGESFLWHPGIHCGFDLHGEGQLGMLHPLHLALYRFLPLNLAFNLEIILNYVFLSLGTYLLFRKLKFLSGAALLGTVVFTLSSFNILHSVHVNIISVCAHLPWSLLALISIFEKSDQRRSLGFLFPSLGIAFLTASQALLGHPQMLWTCHFMELIFLIYLLIIHSNLKSAGRLHLIGIFFFMKLAGILIGSLQLFPTYETASQSLRDNLPIDFLYSFSLHPENLIQLISPYFFYKKVTSPYFFEIEKAHELGIYCGSLATLSVLYFFLNKENTNPLPGLRRLGLILFILTLVLAFGRYGYLFELQTKTPLINSFRCPARYVFLTQFVMAIFVSLMGHHLLQQLHPSSQLKTKPIIGASVILIVASLSVTVHGHFKGSNTDSHLIAACLIIGFCLILFILCHLKMKLAFPLLAFFTAVDQGVYNLNYFSSDKFQTIEHYEKSFRLPPDTKSRMYSQKEYGSYIGFAMSGSQLTHGAGVALAPKKKITEFSDTWAQVAGVGWVYKELGPRRYSWSPAASPPLPRCRLVSHSLLSGNLEEDILKINPQETALVEDNLPLEKGLPGSVTVQSDRPGLLSATVICPTKQLLIFNESYHSGWTASLNGKIKPLERVNGDFLGVVVPPGQYSVIFKFNPKSLEISLYSSFIGIILLSLFSFFSIRKVRPFQ